jgi:hypothetical protein
MPRPARRRAPRSSPATASTYVLTITLRDIDPPIWRRVRVRGDLTLDRLHHVIQAAMGWTNSHLHQFLIGQEGYSDPGFEVEDTKDERRLRLSDISRANGARFTYEYDFGDGWEHTIVIDDIQPAGKSADVPVCLDGARACPPEDCGGPFGYAENFLAAISDPRHPEHKEMLGWIGGAFDPERFDLKGINRALARVGKRSKR